MGSAFVPASQVILLNNRLLVLPGVHKDIELVQQQKFVQIYNFGGAFSESFEEQPACIFTKPQATNYHAILSV